jgi:hypothetical protein
MLITRQSPFSKKYNTQDIPVTQDQLNAWDSGVLIQHAMPNLTADQREFIKTGITAEEWDEAFGETSDEKDDTSFSRFPDQDPR